jgi:uncharacterized membrane protein
MLLRTTPSTTDLYIRAGLLGFVAGLRSQYPLLLLAVAAQRGDFARRAATPLSIFRSRLALPGFGAAALGELVGDKLPITPSRLKPPQLAVRLLMGGLAGAAIAEEAGASPLAGAAFGAVASGAGSFAGNRFRAAFARLAHLPDLAGALIEDAAALGLGWLVVGRSTSR